MTRLKAMPRLEAVALAAVIIVTVLAFAAPLLAPSDPILRVARPFLAPTVAHPLGTDEIGRDLLSRVLYGVSLSWLPSLVVILVAMTIGTLVGATAGAAGGAIDFFLSRLTELFIVIPSTLIALAAVAAIGPGTWHTVAAISVFWWPWYARIVRTEIHKVAARPHVEAARLVGVGRLRLVLRHLLPAAIPTVIVTATLDVANVILVLSLFSFLGLGAPAPAPELGAMTAQTLSSLTTHWWLPIAPAAAIFVLAFIANLAGDGLQSLFRA